jgi:hypothetical protein
MVVAASLHKSVEELLEEVSAEEIILWMAYHRANQEETGNAPGSGFRRGKRARFAPTSKELTAKMMGKG